MRSVNQDLVVIDPVMGWAGAYSIKRGGGSMGAGLRKPLERDVACVRLLLRSYLRDQGYSTVDVTTSACIDWCGAAGLPPHLTVQGPDVDAHFGVPVIATVERMTDHLRDELHRAIPDLLRPLIQRFESLPPVQTRPVPDVAHAASEPQDDATVKRLVEAIFPVGPDAIRLPIRTRNPR